MDKHIVLLQYRGGSTYFNYIVSDRYEDESRVQDLKDAGLSTPGFLTTTNRYIAPYEDDPICDVLPFLDSSKFRTVSRRVWLGDWWGQCSADLVPGPYDINTPTSWSADFVGKYIEDGWKFLAIVRNGANQVASTSRYFGTHETKRNQEDSDDFFRFLVKGWRNKARIVIDSARAYPSAYKIIKYEDIINNPRQQLLLIDNYLNIGLNIRRCLYRAWELRRDAKHFHDLKHSSFTNEDFNNRWKSWTPDQIAFFWSTCSTEMKDLGYSV